MTNSKIYYFACSYPLEVGSIVLPGNWGRIVSMYNTKGFGNAWIKYREDVFEKVREENYPEKPSRLSSIFLCESVDNLREFLQQSQRPIDLLYEVELIDTDKPVHRGCLNYLDFNQQENLESFKRKAIEYWEAQHIERPEIFTTSRVRITNALKI